MTDLDDVRRQVALGCRILAATETTTPILGHISVRFDEGRVLVRCRGPQERGLLFTGMADIRAVSLDDSGDIGDGYRLPNEFPIHAEILRARPDVRSVVHAHPSSAVVADLAGVPLRPVFGAFDIPAFRLAADGVPVYPRRGLVSTAMHGRQLSYVMGDANVCLLRGHGIVTVGDRAVQAVVRALSLHRLAEMALRIGELGGRPQEVSSDDHAELPELGAAFNEDALWRYHVARLGHQGLADVG